LRNQGILPPTEGFVNVRLRSPGIGRDIVTHLKGDAASSPRRAREAARKYCPGVLRERDHVRLGQDSTRFPAAPSVTATILSSRSSMSKGL
jgi:hypothetical protein